MSNTEIINELFALRMNYEEELLDERDIIIEMKYFLRGKNMTPDDINTTIYQFYSQNGIPISQEEISSIQLPPTVSLNQILQPLFTFENIMHLDSNGNPLPPTQNNNLINQNNDDNNSDTDEISDNNEDDSDDDNDNDNSVNEIHNQALNQIPQINFSSLFNIPINSTNQNHVQVLNQMINLLNSTAGLNQNLNMNMNFNPQFNDVVTTLEKDDLDKIQEYELTEDSDDMCPITMEPFKKGLKVMKLPCNHIFEATAIKEYLEKYNYKCPTCKKEVGKGHANI